MSNFSEYTQYDGLGLAELIRQKQVTPAEVLESAIERIETHNPALNAVIHTFYARARETVKTPPPVDAMFAGVPFLVKDLLSEIAGEPTSAGNRLLKNLPAKQDTETVRRWRAAGLIPVGKTNTPEFGLTPYTEPGAFGATRNPWNLERIPGGSSGGSAAAVAARLVPLASGGDGGGSIRIPASACGLFGFKPTRGRVPTGPTNSEFWQGFATEHVLTRSVRDSAAALDAVDGDDIGAPYAAPARPSHTFLEAVGKNPGKLRIAFTSKPMLGKNVHPEVLRGLEETVRLLQELGHELVETAPVLDGEAFGIAFVTVLAGELRADIEEAAALAGKRPSVDDFDPSSFGMGILGQTMSAADYAAATRYLQRAARQVSQFYADYDVILTPTLAAPPLKIGELQPSANDVAQIKLIGRTGATWLVNPQKIVRPLAAQTYEFTPWTPVFNVTGQPAMSVPLYWTPENLPVGMHFVGKFGADATLFRLAAQLEEARPWADKTPSGF
jgi:amidase